jgi:hypothetical protein
MNWVTMITATMAPIGPAKEPMVRAVAVDAPTAVATALATATPAALPT